MIAMMGMIDPGVYRKHNWVKQIEDMHEKFGVHEWMKSASPEERKQFLAFRLEFLKEELDETYKAFVDRDPEEVTDGLIDLCVVAIGTLDAFGVDAHRAWNEVMRANMAKEVGVKDSRPNPLGLPDLVKPSDWVPPSHEGNGVVV